jgi:hypothetical protein
MFFDGEAAITVMPYTTFRKLGMGPGDLTPTSIVLNDFVGNPSNTKGCVHVDLMIGSKTLLTTFFVIEGKGAYSLLLGRDWIHANYCIPSTMHQQLVQWVDDDVEVVQADDSVNMANVRKTLECTRKHGIKMNPNKCAFGVSAGEFLGFLVHEGGIEVGKKSMKAIDQVVPPTNLKELQSMHGKINFVRRFISTLSQKVLPFSPLLRIKKDQKFVWGDEQQKAFN